MGQAGLFREGRHLGSSQVPSVRAAGPTVSLRRVRMTLVALQCSQADPVTGDVEVGGESAATSSCAGSLSGIGRNAGASSTSRETGAFRPARGSAAFRVKSMEGAGRRSFVNVLGLGGRLQRSKNGRFALGWAVCSSMSGVPGSRKPAAFTRCRGSGSQFSRRARLLVSKEATGARGTEAGTSEASGSRVPLRKTTPSGIRETRAEVGGAS